MLSVQPGRFTFTGPMSHGIALDIGTTVTLRVDGIDLVLAGSRHQVLDTGFFTHAGLQPTDYAVVVVKSSQHFRAAFGPIAGEVLVVDGGGLTTRDYARMPFRRLRRPISPLDLQ